ncbi:MAG: hypothetical protein CVT67_08235 [Actinobacteria bacterium HGW-Actinobacteria-7]|jgi:hypothetical protein|nr:MAG: hypothetical protein CVT67_08235 [Actinobacteria bacterium HGW-Actinobacteria-7]
MRRQLLLAAALLLSVLTGCVQVDAPSPSASIPAQRAEGSAGNAAAYVSGEQVQGVGTVTRVLSDDNDGSRHQRFIIELSSGQTLLIAHNIDLAPRLPGLKVGDTVEFYGEFETNPQGGVIHWTHRDPSGSHVAGWLKYKGATYQ